MRVPDGDVLGVDVLARILRNLRLSQVLTSKGVCKTWANGARRTIQNKAWRDANWAEPVGYSRLESAHHAFDALGACERVDKRLVANKCRSIWKIHGIDGPRGGSMERLLWHIFENSHLRLLFSKSVRVVQQRDSDNICIFSDVYACDDRSSLLDEFARLTTAGGLETRVFEIDYPGLDFRDGYRPPKRFKPINTGYSVFYRGKLRGVVL